MKNKILKALLKRNMLVAFLMGASSGLPLLLAGRTLQGWMTVQDVKLSTIGFFSLAGLPYTLKFIWAPIFDRFTLPFLGRRRGWILVTQVSLLITMLILAIQEPKESLALVAGLALLMSFFSASQDVVVDAYRRESLSDEELGLGSSFYVYGYRTAMWLSGGLAFMLAGQMSWNAVYLVMAGVMAVCAATTLFAIEPKLEGKPPKSMTEAVVDPLREFFTRKGAIMVLLFVLFYKMGDTMAGAMATPFYIKIGFTTTQIGAIAKTFGFFSLLGGLFLGGVLILRWGIERCLWIFGILQALSTAGFAVLSQVGPSLGMLTWVIAFEDLTGGMGTAAFTAFMAAQTNRRFTATQYALLTSLMGVPRVVVSSFTGVMAESMGWYSFFIFCTAMAVPGLLMLMYMIAPANRGPKRFLAFAFGGGKRR